MSVVALLLAGLVPATAAGAAVDPTLTPDGPATVSSVWRGPVTTEGLGPQVLTAVRVTVGPGGNGGPIRLRVSSPLDRERGTQLGPWVDLPATPGTYEFPAPPLHWDYRSGVIAIDQQIGWHAIVVPFACQPQFGQGDPCNSQALAVFHDVADADPAVGTAITPPDRHPGRRLAVEGVTAPDSDGDRVANADDHTALRITATRAFTAQHVAVLRVTIHNDGPRDADRPFLLSGVRLPGAGAWLPACLDDREPPYPGAFALSSLGGLPWSSLCRLAPLAAGETRTVSTTLSSDFDATPITLRPAGDGGQGFLMEGAVTVAPPRVLALRARADGRRVTVVASTHRRGRLTVVVAAGRWRTTRIVAAAGPGNRELTVRVPRRVTSRVARVTVTLGSRHDGVAASARVGLRPSR